MSKFMRRSIITAAGAVLSIIVLVSATHGQGVDDHGESGVPPNEVLQSKLLEVADSLGWALMFEDRQEGLFIWRLKITSLEHRAWEGRFAWYMKRIGEEIAVDDPMLVTERLAQTEVPQKEERILLVEARTLQEEFKRRWLERVGPVKFRGPHPSTHSAEKFAAAMSRVMNTAEVPIAAGDLVIIATNLAKITVKGKVVDTAARGTVLEIWGFAGKRLQVRHRRAGTISRDDVMFLEQAITKSNDEIRQAPQSSVAHAVRGNARAFLGKFQEAIADFDQAIRLDPNSATAFHRRGLALAMAGNYTDSVRDFSQALRFAPNDAQILHDRALAFSKVGENKRALADLHKAVRQDSHYALAYGRRGAVWANMGENDKALADYNRALQLDPTDARILFTRGHIWARKGDWSRATEDLQKATRLDTRFLLLVASSGT